MIRSHALTALATLSALVVACGGGDTSGEAPEKTEASSTAASAPAEAASPPAADDVTTADGTNLAKFTGDAANGKIVFGQCRACHVTDAGANRLGPTLHGIIGRKAGSVAGFSYSPANANSGITWSKEKLFQYLEKPQRIIPNSKMVFAGMPDAQKRADLIAYLENPN